MATPIAGNNNFTKVENLVGSLTTLTVKNAKLSSLDVDGSVSVGLLNQHNALPGLGSLHQVVGYAPVGFSTAAINQIHFLNSVPNSAAATSVNSPQLLLLPEGAKVVGAVVTNNGVTITNSGSSTYDISSEVWSASPAAAGNIASAMTLAIVNAGGNVGFASTPSPLGGVGNAYTAALSAALPNTGVNVQTLVGANLTGDLAVLVSYLL